jgi:hypothetical protein
VDGMGWSCRTNHYPKLMTSLTREGIKYSAVCHMESCQKVYSSADTIEEALAGILFAITLDGWTEKVV